MRRFLYTLGALTLIIVVVVGIGLVVLFYKGNALDAESKAFVDSAIPAIAATWNQRKLVDLSAPELRKSVRPGQMNALFDDLSRLGHLLKYRGATGEAATSLIAGTGVSVSASYVAKADFENGHAIFHILLVKRGGRWMITGFHVEVTPNHQRARAATLTHWRASGFGGCPSPSGWRGDNLAG